MTTKYEPGSLCWADLATNDLAGSKAFYASLLNWRMHDSAVTGGMTYSMAYVGDDSVAAIQTGGPGTPGSPGASAAPSWLVYISVASVDDAIKRAKVLGGDVVRPPHDVMDAGRMALVKGPTGAHVALWEGRKHPGAGKMRANGAMCWFELATSDTGEASAFYRGMFGWTAKTSPEYTELQRDGTSVAGMLALRPDQKAASWLVYFQVANVDAKVDQAQKLGAKLVVPATDIPGSGRFAILADPQGASFALYGASTA